MFIEITDNIGMLHLINVNYIEYVRPYKNTNDKCIIQIPLKQIAVHEPYQYVKEKIEAKFKE